MTNIFKKEGIDFMLKMLYGGDILFYDVFLNFEDLYLDNDIIKKLEEIEISREKANMNYIDEAWRLTTEICDKYLKEVFVNDIGIGNKDQIIEDIKNHCIFNIYTSLYIDRLEEKSKDKLYSEYREKMGLHGKGKVTKLNNAIKNMEENLITPEESLYQSDFYIFIKYILNKKYMKINADIFNYIAMSGNIFPYFKENISGVEYKDLCKVYEVWDNIQKNYRYDNSRERLVSTYIFERLYHVSFMYQLTILINDFIKNGNSAQNMLSGYINCENKFITLKCDCEDNENVRMSKASQQLIYLMDIISIPLVFKRNEYLKIANGNSNIDRKGIFLLNSIIPLMTNVLYKVLNLSCKKNKKEIYYLGMDYIDKNQNYYNYEQLWVKPNELLNSCSNEALEVNITHLVYNYNFKRNPNREEENWFAILDELYKYNFDTYTLNFPENTIYNKYLMKKIKNK